MREKAWSEKRLSGLVSLVGCGPWMEKSQSSGNHTKPPRLPKKNAKKRPTEKSKKHPKSGHKGIKIKEKTKIKAKKGDSGQKLYQCAPAPVRKRVKREKARRRS